MAAAAAVAAGALAQSRAPLPPFSQPSEQHPAASAPPPVGSWHPSRASSAPPNLTGLPGISDALSTLESLLCIASSRESQAMQLQLAGQATEAAALQAAIAQLLAAKDQLSSKPGAPASTSAPSAYPPVAKRQRKESPPLLQPQPLAAQQQQLAPQAELLLPELTGGAQLPLSMVRLLPVEQVLQLPVDVLPLSEFQRLPVSQRQQLPGDLQLLLTTVLDKMVRLQVLAAQQRRQPPAAPAASQPSLPASAQPQPSTSGTSQGITQPTRPLPLRVASAPLAASVFSVPPSRAATPTPSASSNSVLAALLTALVSRPGGLSLAPSQAGTN